MQSGRPWWLSLAMIAALSTVGTILPIAVPAAEALSGAGLPRRTDNSLTIRKVTGKGLNAYQADTSRPDAFSPPGPQDDATRNNLAADCRAGMAVVNRRQWCAFPTATLIATDDDGVETGRAELTFVVLIYGRDDGRRSASIFVRTDSVRISGSVTLADTVGIEIICQLALPGCTVNGGVVTSTLQVWQDRQAARTWLTWTLDSDERQSTLADRVLYHNVGMKATSPMALPPEVEADLTRVRCDSATYFGVNRQKACIVYIPSPRIVYPILNNAGGPSRVNEVALHIQDAQNTPNLTYPNYGTSKSIPGKYDPLGLIPALHRVALNGPVAVANVTAKDQACRAVPVPTVGPGCRRRQAPIRTATSTRSTARWRGRRAPQTTSRSAPWSVGRTAVPAGRSGPSTTASAYSTTSATRSTCRS
jgi:hypothetical protein